MEEVNTNVTDKSTARPPNSDLKNPATKTAEKKTKMKLRKMSVSGNHLETHKVKLNALTSPYRGGIPNMKNFMPMDIPKFHSVDIVKISKESELEKYTMEELSFKKYSEHLSTNNSIISDSIMGQLVSKLQCETCKAISYSFEPFYLLELALPADRDVITLKELLTFYTKMDTIENFLWDCYKCKQKRKVSKSCQIWKLPKILIVYYKRFEYTEQGIRKNNALVKINVGEGEDLGGFVSSPFKPQAKYFPYFVIHHFGEMDQGHYSCSYFDNVEWTVIDDTSVRVLKEISAVNEFYRLS